MYDAIVWVFMTVKQASVCDANVFVIIFLIWHSWLAGIFPIQNVLIRWYIYRERKQGEESLPQSISILREESLLQIFSGIYDPHAILKNLSKQDMCLDSRDLIDWASNDVDLYDQNDSKDSRDILGSQLIGSQWIMLHCKAGASGISGQETTFCIFRVWAPRYQT